MKDSKFAPESSNMPIVRIAPVCNGKIYVVPRPAPDGESSRLDLPIEETVEHVSTKSDKVARKVKEKYHLHLNTDAAPRFCVMHRPASSGGETIHLYVLPLKREDEIFFREGKFVNCEDISRHPEAYATDLQMESELLGMAAGLWDVLYKNTTGF